MSDSSSDYPATSDGSSVAQVERAQLCDLFASVGPAAPTLCAGWDTAHLAAHLVTREGSPLSLAAALVRRRSGDETVDTLARSRDFDALVETLRAGPPRTSVFGTRFTDRLFNAVEFFVHHEDVRRAGPAFDRRELPAWAQDEIWRNLKLTLGGLMRKAPVGAAVRRSDTGEMRVAAKKPRAVVVAGLATELALFANGRGAVADVTLDGDPDDVAALRSARLGF